MSGAMTVIVFLDCIHVHSPDGELSLRECPGIIKTMHTGFSAHYVLHYANAPVLTRKKPDVMI